MKIYLAGPIDHCNDSEAIDWREQAKKRLGEENCLDPMRRDYRGREHLYSEIVSQDLNDIDGSDVVLANCWQPGFGTAMEILYASLNEKTVIVVVDPDSPFVSPWLRYYATTVYGSLDTVLNDLADGIYG